MSLPAKNEAGTVVSLDEEHGQGTRRHVVYLLRPSLNGIVVVLVVVVL